MALFIAFDGPNGVGKTTLIKTIYKKLVTDNKEVYVTSEPTNNSIGSFTRKISEETDGYSLACLVAADRYDHLKRDIEPALLAGKIVLCDRYFASSLVLQRIDGVDQGFILEMNSNVKKPDIYFILNTSPEVLTRRLRERNIDLTRFESKEETQLLESTFYKETVQILRNLDIKTYEIDTSGIIEEYANEVYEIITDYTKNHKEKG